MQVKAEEVILNGSPICRGIAIGKTFFLNRDDFKIIETSIPSHQVQREVIRYRHALQRSKQDIKRLQKQLEIESAPEGILILEAQLEMLHDPLMTTEIEKEISESKKNVEFILQQALMHYHQRFQALNDPFFIERFKDLQDLARRVLSYLNESGNYFLNHVPPHSIVCTQELTASDAASAHHQCVGAFITESDAATTHAAIVAKSKGIPYLTNINLTVLKEYQPDILIVDGRSGRLIINPTAETLEHYENLKDQITYQAKSLSQMVRWPSQTFDGYSIRLSANLDTLLEIDLIQEMGGQGIGLFRSEYIFLPKNEIPSEEEQYQVYRAIAERMKDQPVIIRTFDLGGDKTSLYHHFFQERSSFLGCRATRLLLKEKAVFKTQIRAILRASLSGNISILFPMISTVSELREAKQLLKEAREELNLWHPVRIGCMIEVPSAALIVDHFVKECDFLSIGTNDLVQYALAVDRSDHVLSEFYEPSDPSVIRLIKLITTEANKAQIPVSVCGEIASDPRFTTLLLGLGVQELSVSPRYLPLIKNSIRHTSIVEAVQLAEKALELKTAQEVLQLLIENYRQHVPTDVFYSYLTAY
jgi:phosphoenolpyruvate-protein phosphotransferase (PTS system enzyme I)